jgi:hypothetical protein
MEEIYNKVLLFIANLGVMPNPIFAGLLLVGFAVAIGMGLYHFLNLLHGEDPVRGRTTTLPPPPKHCSFCEGQRYIGRNTRHPKKCPVCEGKGWVGAKS